MVLGLAMLGARLSSLGIKTAGASKAAVQTAPARTGWGVYAKTGIVGASVGAGGLGLSSAIGSAQESIEQGGHGLLLVGGVIVAIILFLFLLLRRN
jgi:hypothetical protein